MKKLLRKLINRETVTYLIFGVLTTAVSFATAGAAKFLLERAGCGDSVVSDVSTVISWICAVTFAYITNRIWVFNSRARGFKAIIKEAALFYGGRLSTLVIETVIMRVGYSVMGINYWITKITANVVVLILNYIISKFIIFRKKKEETDEQQHTG